MIIKARRITVLVAAITIVLAPTALALAQWPSWWEWIAKEQTPMTWLQSVVLVVAALLSALVGVAVAARRAGPARPWLVLGAGLTVLALDERFALHERIRDRLLAPREISVPILSRVGPGDFLLMVVGLVGLVMLPVVLRGLATDRSARNAFVLGVLLSVVAVAMDSVDPAAMSLAAERLEQTAEESVELAAGVAFATALALRLLGLLDPVEPIAADPVATRVQGTTHR